MSISNCLNPNAALLSKLGSLIIHYQEFLSPGGHEYDRTTITQLENDPDVQSWLKDMGPMLPVKRC